ncbi:pectinesterase 3 [Cornus florida]|uniref:pectinesterase 3 n=1 Tax=Cornus florida TaxID=4283 RepID=UPI00289A02E4|nr:pectinesterase 3 [Cornus florida]
MDSINIFKGYDKVHALEQDQPLNRNSKTARNRLIVIAVSSIVVLTVIIGTFVGALIHESLTEDESLEESANSAHSLRAVCSVTQYPDSCFTTISSLNHPLSSSKPDPELIFNLSLQVAVNELTHLSKTLIPKSNDPGTESALRDCVDLFGAALSQLNRSAASMGVGSAEEMMTEVKINDMKTWISAAMTDGETCLDGLEEMGSTVLDEVRSKVQKSKEYMSNSLAILANIDTLLRKFDLTMH